MKSLTLKCYRINDDTMKNLMNIIISNNEQSFNGLQSNENDEQQLRIDIINNTLKYVNINTNHSNGVTIEFIKKTKE